MTKRQTRRNATNATRKRPKKAVTRAHAKSWPGIFIAELRKRGIVKDAAKVAHVDRATVYRHKESDAGFAAEWTDALEDAVDMMEAEAIRRAVKGVRKPVYQQGKLVGYVHEYSDALMSLLLRANRPAKFNPPQELKHDVKGELTAQVFTHDVITRLAKARPTEDRERPDAGEDCGDGTKVG